MLSRPAAAVAHDCGVPSAGSVLRRAWSTRCTLWPAQHETIIVVQELSCRLRAHRCGRKGGSHDELADKRGQCGPIHEKVGERALEETQSHQKDGEREHHQAPTTERRRARGRSVLFTQMEAIVPGFGMVLLGRQVRRVGVRAEPPRVRVCRAGKEGKRSKHWEQHMQSPWGVKTQGTFVTTEPHLCRCRAGSRSHRGK